MTIRGSKVLVTGAGGFIGSHLVEALVRAGAEIRALVHYNSRNSWGLLERIPGAVRREIEVVSGDVRDPFLMRGCAAGCNAIFHLASLIAIPYSYRAPSSYVETNVAGAVNVMQAALDAGVERVVHTSTSEVYGTARYVPIDEAHPLQGQSPYSASKIGADKIAESFHLSFGLPVATIRPFNTYGPRQSARAVIPTIITQALEGREIRLGSLTPTRDLNYVDDTVEGFLRVAEAPAAVGTVTNVGSGREIGIGPLAELILRLMERDVPIACDEERVRPEKSEVGRLVCDNQKAKAMLGWEPRVSLEEGLRRTIEWIAAHGELYKSGGYVV